MIKTLLPLSQLHLLPIVLLLIQFLRDSGLQLQQRLVTRDVQAFEMHDCRDEIYEKEPDNSSVNLDEVIDGYSGKVDADC